MVLSGRPEFALYAALKLDLYARHPQAAHQADQRAPATSMPLITARGVHKAMAPRGRQRQPGAWRYTDFFDTSAHFLRERLRNLNHGTALEEIGHGTRNSVQYRWKEPVDAATGHSFAQLSSLMGPRLPLALDLYRLAEAFGPAGATVQQVVRIFREHRARFVERRWYRIATGTSARSPEFTQLVLARMDTLVQGGLLLFDGTVYRLTPRGDEAVHWFELFVHSASFRTNNVVAPARRPLAPAAVAASPHPSA